MKKPRLNKNRFIQCQFWMTPGILWDCQLGSMKSESNNIWWVEGGFEFKLVVTSIATDEELLFSLKYILHQEVTTWDLYQHQTSSSSSKLRHCRNYFLVNKYNNINYYQSPTHSKIFPNVFHLDVFVMPIFVADWLETYVNLCSLRLGCVI